mgnify:CR=1 FL=1
MSQAFPTKFDHYQEEKENDEKFSHIPDDLITEYLDLNQRRSELQQAHQMRLSDLVEAHKKQEKLILLDLTNNRKKMEEMSGLESFALTRRLPPRRDIEPPY